MQIIGKLISSKKGKLYFRLIIAVAIVAAAIYSYSALAAVPAATPVIVNNNGTLTSSSIQITNASIARASKVVK